MMIMMDYAGAVFNTVTQQRMLHNVFIGRSPEEVEIAFEDYLEDNPGLVPLVGEYGVLVVNRIKPLEVTNELIIEIVRS